MNWPVNAVFTRCKSVTGNSNKVEGSSIFIKGLSKSRRPQEEERAELFEQIGRLKTELEWVKKIPPAVEIKRGMIEPDHGQIIIRRQCDLLGLSKSSFYYEPGNDVMVKQKRTLYFKQHSKSFVSQNPSGFCIPGRNEAGKHCRT